MLPVHVVDQFTTLLIGFSVFGCVLLWCAYAFFISQMRKSAYTIAWCAILLAGLAILQICHFEYLISGTDLLDHRGYGLLLLLVPAAFFFFSTGVLMPDRRVGAPPILHLAPVVAGIFMPVPWMAPIAFAIGTGYSLWFTHVIYRLRSDRPRFKFEMFFFGIFALMALVILALGVSIPYIDDRIFYLIYANATGIALLLVITGLIAFPELLSDLSDAAEVAYASSTLTLVDKEAALRRLENCMTEQRLFEDEALNLASLAEACELSSHQLSELINTSFGVGFSRYVRRQRVEQAKGLLLSDPSASVLSIGLATGFRSQSAFYAAFGEETGQAPGQFRKTHAHGTSKST